MSASCSGTGGSARGSSSASATNRAPRFLVQHQKHVLAVLAPVTRDLPQAGAVQQRRLDLPKMLLLPLAHEIHQLVEDDCALFRPEHRAGRKLVEHHEVELLGQHPMVAALRLLDAMQMR